MRRLALLFAGGTVWLFLFALPVLADNGPHQKGQFSGTTPASCAGCHRAHSAQAADILQQPMPQLCYACHGAGATGATTDVQDGVAYSTTTDVHVAGAPSTAGFAGPLRGGGFDYALINTASYYANPTYPTTSRIGTIPPLTAGAQTQSTHSVDGSPQTMWGAGPISATKDLGTADVQLTCGSCHDPHGNGQYRILRPAPDDITVAGVATVAINDAGSKSYTTQNYGQNGLYAQDDSALNADGTALEYKPGATSTDPGGYQGTYLEASSRWCQMCHTRYFGGTDSALESSGDAIFKFRHAERNLVDPKVTGAVVNGSGYVTPITSGTAAPKNADGTNPTGVSLITYNPQGGQTSSSLQIGSYYDSSCNLVRGTAVYLNPPYDPVSFKSGYDASLGGPGCYTFATATATHAKGLFVNNQYISAVASHATVGGLTTGAPRCITCHVSHGSNAAMASSITSQWSPGLTFDANGQQVQTTDAQNPSVTNVHLDGTLLRLNNRGVCEACHNK